MAPVEAGGVKVSTTAVDRCERQRALQREIPVAHWPKVVVAANAGMRRGDLFALEWKRDVDFKTRLLRDPASKTDSPHHIPMNATLYETLHGLPSRFNSRWVFPNATNTGPIDGDNFYSRVFVPALKRAGIADFRWHDLRHTFASRLVLNGAPLYDVQRLLGHSTIKTTERYAHLSPARLAETIRLLDSREMVTNSVTALTGSEGAR